MTHYWQGSRRVWSAHYLKRFRERQRLLGGAVEAVRKGVLYDLIVLRNQWTTG